MSPENGTNAGSATNMIEIGNESIGNIGGALFRKSVIAFDYGDGALWIAPATASSRRS